MELPEGAELGDELHGSPSPKHVETLLPESITGEREALIPAVPPGKRPQLVGPLQGLQRTLKRHELDRHVGA
jgi:hypothetical protein